MSVPALAQYLEMAASGGITAFDVSPEVYRELALDASALSKYYPAYRDAGVDGLFVSTPHGQIHVRVGKVTAGGGGGGWGSPTPAPEVRCSYCQCSVSGRRCQNCGAPK